MSKLSEDSLRYIISRLVDNAKDAAAQSERDKSDALSQGRRLAYYEMLDIIKTELDIEDADLKQFGLDFNPEDLA